MTRGALGSWFFAVLVAVSPACASTYGASDPPPGDLAASCTLDCGPHGTCVGAGSDHVCACQPGYVGPDCRGCADGLQDDNHDGTCEASCATTKCGSHEACQIAAGAPVCVCVVGYEKNAGACAWKDTLLDPTFENKPAGAWTLEGGATIDPALAGGVSPGRAVYPAGCGNARVSQSVVMPAFTDAEPLALDVSSFCPGTISCHISRFDLAFTGRFHHSVGGPDVVTERFCLGERAFGGPLTVAFTPTSCSAGNSLDNAAIVRAPECPGPGQIVNGDFESSGGWKPSGTGAEIAVGAGTGGSRAAHLTLAKRCDDPTLTGLFSVPSSSRTHAALAINVKGTSQQTMNVVARGVPLAAVTGTGVFEKVSVCLPEWSRGLVIPLSFGLTGAGNGACGEALSSSDFLLDDLAIVSDPACADPPLVIDGGFEATGSVQPWNAGSLSGSLLFLSGSAHSGKGYAAVTTNGGGCAPSGLRPGATSSFGQAITVPDPSHGSGGPQLRFWYRGYSYPAGTAQLAGAEDMLVETNAWTQHTKCLDPKRAGRDYSLQFSYQGMAGCTDASLQIDDVDIVHDKSCPE